MSDKRDGDALTLVSCLPDLVGPQRLRVDRHRYRVGPWRRIVGTGRSELYRGVSAERADLRVGRQHGKLRDWGRSPRNHPHERQVHGDPTTKGPHTCPTPAEPPGAATTTTDELWPPTETRSSAAPVRQTPPAQDNRQKQHQSSGPTAQNLCGEHRHPENSSVPPSPKPEETLQQRRRCVTNSARIVPRPAWVGGEEQQQPGRPTREAPSEAHRGCLTAARGRRGCRPVARSHAAGQTRRHRRTRRWPDHRHPRSSQTVPLPPARL